MHTSAPQISILMAVYEPNLQWLKEQLDSLEAQTYPNLKMYVCDDCSPTCSFDVLKDIVNSSIHSFPVIIERNEKNLGSTFTFERLTAEADGEYFAYCDQDDIWLPEKLSTLKNAIEQDDALLVCSDMYVIDSDGKQIADSILKINKKQQFLTGRNQATKLLYNNCFTGCAMLIRAEVARNAIPFCPFMIHDYYLAIASAVKGLIVSIPKKLIKYRIHPNNQSAPMVGIKDKQDYYEERIETYLAQYNWLIEKFNTDADLTNDLSNRIKWMEARKAWFYGNRAASKTLWEYRKFSILTTFFELLGIHKSKHLLPGLLSIKKRSYK